LFRVVRTGGVKAAITAQHRTDGELIKADNGD